MKAIVLLSSFYWWLVWHTPLARLRWFRHSSTAAWCRASWVRPVCHCGARLEPAHGAKKRQNEFNSRRV